MQFSEAGAVNTQATLDAASQRARALGILVVVGGATTGATAGKSRELLKYARMIAGTEQSGVRQPIERGMPRANPKKKAQKRV